MGRQIAKIVVNDILQRAGKYSRIPIIAIVGNGPITEPQNSEINQCDIVIRCNHMPYFIPRKDKVDFNFHSLFSWMSADRAENKLIHVPKFVVVPTGDPNLKKDALDTKINNIIECNSRCH